MVAVKEYVDASGKSPFGVWFTKLDSSAAAKVAVALERIARGHTSAMKALGRGVLEYKIDYGPGYRIYFGRDGERLVILLAGGSKKRQRQDIETATETWKEYKQRKKEE